MRSLLPLARTATALALLALAAGCAVEVQNTQPARELERAARPPGSVYTGWRVFQDKCATCHGADAAGGAQAPDLLARVGAMGPRRFVGLVLARYDWGLPPAAEGEARAAQVESVLKGQTGRLEMPAWQGEPRVAAHIVDLYAYLSARAEGRQGAGRPLP
ncbi:MAG: c-type cytochrome [Rubrivivax sp.]